LSQLPDPARSVLIAVSPNQRALEIVTGPAARRHLLDRDCKLAALSMTAAFNGGDVAGGTIARRAQPANHGRTLPGPPAARAGTHPGAPGRDGPPAGWQARRRLGVRQPARRSTARAASARSTEPRPSATSRRAGAGREPSASHASLAATVSSEMW